jgi:dipeptidyl aminopeptidase/acylaminoacyl peptidase
MFRTLICGVILVTLAPDVFAEGYQRPPKAVTDILDAAPLPAALVSPTGENLLLVKTARYPSIEEVAAPQLRLAGLRIDPKTNGPARPTRVTGLTLVPLPEGQPTEIELPKHGKAGFPLWSPDGKRFAVMLTTPKGIELWVAELKTGAKLEQVPGVTLNATIGDAMQWMPGSSDLLVQLIPAKRGDPPAAPAAPSGPVVQESDGKAAPVRTYQDLLQNPQDAALFEYYCASQLAVVNAKSHKVRPLGGPAIVTGSDPSPGGRHVLVSRLNKPFSYLLPYSHFPMTVEVLETETGKVAYTVTEKPLQDKIPIEGVPTGPRAVQWAQSELAMLVWTEALDDGDPRKKVPHRDQLFALTVGIDKQPRPLFKLEHRFAGISYTLNHSYVEFFDPVLVREYDRERKWVRTSRYLLLKPEDAPKVLSDRSAQDRYGDPGTAVTFAEPSSGARGLRDGFAGLLLNGDGATPKGDRPFLDRLDFSTGKTTRLWQCAEGVYEHVAVVLNDEATKLIIRRESPTEPPALIFRDGKNERKLAQGTDPWPELRKARKELVTTKRADGTTISFTLYLPPGHKEGDKVPAVFYAYPTEFVSADTAGQVSGSPNRFTTVSGFSHLFFLTQGYAVVEVSMPVVGPPASANDTFVDQLVSNAKAAIDKAAEFGIDPARVGVMGHSYGAFMTANLLAHSDLFRAGIARSGAYNRTLTPFGFQNERRTFWEAPEVYGKMSPFNHAHKVNEPLLLIHGQADNNPGTFTVQSERMYAAVRANGGTVKLVLLPHESHGYEARESVEHVLYEQFAWFDKYVKGKKD